ncbi:MAG: hypothetical protein R3F55_03295 [Alphaproteobacteria bacterium]
MRTIALAAFAAALTIQAGTALADSTIPGAATDVRPQSPATTVELLPANPQFRPNGSPVLPALLLPAIQAAREAASSQADADGSVDVLLGTLPGGPAAADAQGAKHIYVDENGELACVTLDTFFPEAC